MNDTPQLTDTDWSLLEEAVRGRPAAPEAAPPPQPASPKVMTADEIVARERARADALHAEATIRGAATVGHGVVFADEAPTGASPSGADSPELIQLRGIHAELRSLCALVAAGINKLPGRRGRP